MRQIIDEDFSLFLGHRVPVQTAGDAELAEVCCRVLKSAFSVVARAGRQRQQRGAPALFRKLPEQLDYLLIRQVYHRHGPTLLFAF
jgi:hypothetical protein